MRCEDVTRELAVPSGAIAPGALTDHLAGCSHCAEWSDQARQFDRLWESTRPAEPSAAAWNALWTKVTRAAEEAETPAIVVLPRRSRVFVWAALAQAAVLLIGVVLLLRGQSDDGQSHSAPGLAAAQTGIGHDEAVAGEPLFICLGTNGERVPSENRVILAPWLQSVDSEHPMSVAWDMELLNSMEGLAESAPGDEDPDSASYQVTAFGLLATRASGAADPKLADVNPKLRSILPDYHGFQRLDTESRRLSTGRSVACRLGPGRKATVELMNPQDTDGKVELKLTLEIEGQPPFSTVVKTPPNQLVFCDRLLPNKDQLLIGVAAR